MPGIVQLWTSGGGLRNDEENPFIIETFGLENTSPNDSTFSLPQFNTGIETSDDEIGNFEFSLSASRNPTGARRKSDPCLSFVPNISIMRRFLGRWPKRYGNLLWVMVIVLGAIFIMVTLFHEIGEAAKSGTKVVEMIAKFGEDEAWREWPKLERYFGGLEELVLPKDNHPEYPAGRWKDEVNETDPNLKGNFLVPVSRVFDPYHKAREDKLYVECDYNDYYHHHEGESQEEHQQEGGADRPLKTRARPEVRSFNGIPQGHPDPIFGSYEDLGLVSDMCFERYGRLGAYGFGYGVNEGGLGVGEEIHTKKHGEGGEGSGAMPMQKIDWRGIDWGKVQERCIQQNKARFAPPAAEEDSGDTWSLLGPRETNSSEKEAKMQRTAFLLRTWDDYKYTSNDIINLRSIISELSINSGGEYTVHLLVHVKNPSIPIWADKQAYNDHLQNSVPREFWGIATLWNEPLMALTYSSLPPNEFRGLPVHGVYRSSFMPVQWFALNHPEYEYLWNWEMDVRYIGHLYHFLQTAAQWAEQQERKFLWDLNERFWIPSVYGNWGEFRYMVRNAVTPSTSTWGNPIQVPGVEIFPTDGKYRLGPGSPEEWGWGIGEPADLITFSPLFNPNSTGWLLEQDTSGYTKQPPRRAAIVATFRLSRRLLLSMHRENAHYKHTAFTEMWPATCALHHGLKAVYFPHPVYIDRRWPVWYVEKTFNHGPQGVSGGAPESVFGPDREHNFLGTTWYYNSEFAGELYRRWALGKAEDGKGSMCMRGMLLHPVKEVPDKL
ncbi:hypothetical protein L211DRAFT_837360 [Terfezia boudieri ATCC MYA-4762]|uniref:Uncharacterized protein n=1 Tax=Terfezia boudieri ATCC MYA-4762 TaxID=1051890 RepID=A0A3N4LNM8_9PEZI|nr:hypothetical protein L211DRAFT_837360 [Terfezia boudieri ATCC MYA-4762]